MFHLWLCSDMGIAPWNAFGGSGISAWGVVLLFAFGVGVIGMCECSALSN